MWPAPAGAFLMSELLWEQCRGPAGQGRGGAWRLRWGRRDGSCWRGRGCVKGENHPNSRERTADAPPGPLLGGGHRERGVPGGGTIPQGHHPSPLLLPEPLLLSVVVRDLPCVNCESFLSGFHPCESLKRVGVAHSPSRCPPARPGWAASSPGLK